MIYVVQTIPAGEDKACFKAQRAGISAWVPKRELTLRKGGEWIRAVDILFPGYVFIDCDYCPKVHYAVTAIPEVLRFLGEPTPITGAEEDFMRVMFNGGYPLSESKVFINSDGTIRITEGWLKGREDYIKDICIRRRRAYIEIAFGGRTHRTSVGAEFTKA